MNNPNCAGIIVIKKIDSNTKQCIIVLAGTTNYGFPKGKIKGKKNNKETYIQGGIRELFEETGIVESQIKFISDDFIDEINSNRNAVVRYYIAEYIDKN
jgi:8-oxo-dGTP pyrophosphatase MutT (NUDIX family)